MSAPVSSHPPLDALERRHESGHPARPGRPVAHAAPPGTVVGSFVLSEVVEHDDFRLCYRARATASDADVLIEEYWPKALVQRGEDGDARLREANYAELYDAGLQAFVVESEALAALAHPALVRIGPMWLARATAYRLRVDTATGRLSRHLEGRPRPVDEAWLRGLAEPLLDALAHIHRADRVHGNVRPSSVALRDDGSPLLLDFGAARSAIAKLAPWRAVSPEPGYTAPELALYGVVPTPASDLYSLAAVLWFCSTGELPETPTAGHALPLSRWQTVLERHPSLRYSAGWMTALERALAFDPAARPQDADAFRRLLAAAPSVLEGPGATPTMPQASQKALATPEEPAWPTRQAAPEPARPSRPAVSEPAWSDHAAPGPTWSARQAASEPAWPSREAFSEPSWPGASTRPNAIRPAREAMPEPAWPTRPAAPATLAQTGRVQPPPFAAAAVPVDDSEPAWQLPIFAGTDAPARVEPEPWPASTRRAVFDGPGSGHSDTGVPWARRPAPPKPKRHWPWAVGGAVLGGAAMLMFGLGSERGFDEFSLSSWFGKTPTAAPASGDAALPAPVAAGVAAMQGAAPPATGGAGGAPVAADTARTEILSQPASPYALPPAGSERDPGRPSSGAPTTAVAPAAPATPRLDAPKPVAPAATRAEAARAPAAGADVARSRPNETDPARAIEARREATSTALDPAAACAPRSNFSLYWCMKTQCDRTVNYTHPQCVALRREDDR